MAVRARGGSAMGISWQQWCQLVIKHQTSIKNERTTLIGLSQMNNPNLYFVFPNSKLRITFFHLTLKIKCGKKNMDKKLWLKNVSKITTTKKDRGMTSDVSANRPLSSINIWTITVTINSKWKIVYLSSVAMISLNKSARTPYDMLFSYGIRLEEPKY
jgi:hypothetical protein